MVTTLVILSSLLLLVLIVVQISRINELTSKIKGEEVVKENYNRWTANGMMVFLIVFLVGVVWSAYYYKNYMLGYGPHASASAHGGDIDTLFNVTLFFTGIVFVLTHIALFYFAYKYREKKGVSASFISHDDRLEKIWTAIPAVVMAGLVIYGLSIWNTAMADVDPNEDFIEIEATGYQFAWAVRYPGQDKKIGEKYFRNITATNLLGMDFKKDKANMDDFIPTGDLLIPKGKKIRVRITARDVLHNFYIPQMRVKMDAIPGLPTYFVFTPTQTTAEYRQALSKYPEYNVPADPAEPNGPKLWQKFDYELACAELCGKGHFSMRRVVKIVEPEEYEAWVKQQKSFYEESIKGTDDDPFKGSVPAFDPAKRAQEFKELLSKAKADEKARVINLNYLTFETGSAKLTAESKYELENLVAAMNDYKEMQVELAGHTDNVGNAASNLTLSQQRAQAVVDYMVAKGVVASRMKPVGFGDTKPVADNGTEDGRAQNRRTEFRILNM
jgi:cytochrome c oxidase subunit 2